MKKVLMNYHFFLQDISYCSSLFWGFILLILSFMIAHHAGVYASSVAGPAVDDLILKNLRLHDMSFVHVEVSMVFWMFCIVYMLLYPQKIPFISKTFALFITVRSLFICLTHLGAPINYLSIPNNLASWFLFRSDLFFSGHVGGPFLLMLLFWDKPYIRYFSATATLFFAWIVLAGHIHYSIDVFAAPFISHGVHAIACNIFAQDYCFFSQVVQLEGE